MVWYLYLSETPVSHFETDCLVTAKHSANSSCVFPDSLRANLRFLPKLIVFSHEKRNFKLLYYNIARQKNQYIYNNLNPELTEKVGSGFRFVSIFSLLFHFHLKT